MDRELVLAALFRRLNTVTGLDDDGHRRHPRASDQCSPLGGRTDDCIRWQPADGMLFSSSKGFAFAPKRPSTGQRQILSIHIPGEIPDLQSLHLHRMDHDLVAVAPSTLGFISHTSMRALTRANPNIAEVLWRDTLIDAAIFREWIVNVGQRPAASRLAHTVVELRRRLAVTGRAAGDTFEMPLTQEQISEALGITPVHANRIIRQLRDDGIVDISRGRVTVLDEAKLAELAQFDDRYLHQDPSLARESAWASDR